MKSIKDDRVFYEEIRSVFKLKKEIRRKFIIRIQFLFIIGNKK